MFTTLDIPLLFSFSIAAYNQMMITSLKMAGGQKMEATMALPHLLTPEGQEETSAMQEHADVLAE